MADFFDSFGQAVSNQYDAATSPWTNLMNGNVTPKSTTINYNQDGTQDITHKLVNAPVNPAEQTQPQPTPVAQPQTMPAPVAGPQAQPQPAPVAGPVPSAMPQGPVAPNAVQPQMTPAVYRPGSAPTTWNDYQNPTLLPENQPQPNAAPVPVNPQAQTQPQMMPTVAPAPQAQPAPAAAPAAQPAPQVQPAPVWSQELTAAGNDPTKLHAIAGNANYPEEVRKAAANKAFDVNVNEKKRLEATQDVTKMLQGDVKAQNQVMRDIRKDDAEGSYVKAILFQALGLHELSKNEQQKLGVNQFGQAILDGGHYTVEKNGQGAITRAWDAEGKRVDDNVLAKMNAQATGQGTHQYGFAGGIHIVPTTGEQLMPRTNSITGQTEFVHMTGANAGQVYSGGEVPMPQAIPTAAAKATNAANIGIAAAGPRAANQYVGKFGAEHGGPTTMGGGVANPAPLPNRVGTTIPGTGVSVPAGGVAPQVAPGARPAPQAQPAPVAAPVAARPAVAQPVAAPTAPGTGNEIAPYNPAVETRAQYENRIKAQGEGQKVIARKAGEVVATAPEIESQVKDINNAVKILDSGEHNIGPMLSGVVGRGPIAQAIGGQFETEQQKNTNMVMDTVNKMAATGLKSLGSNPSTADLKFWTENKPKANSNPDFVKSWIENARGKLERSLEYNKKQIGTGVGRGTEPTTLDTSGIKIIKREKIQ